MWEEKEKSYSPVPAPLNADQGQQAEQAISQYDPLD